MAGYSLVCSNCHMTFKSPSLLSKHRDKFCVGGKVGDPVTLIGRTDGRYTYNQQPISPESLKVVPPYDYWRDAQIWNLAENHGKNMANLTAQNESLEQQKNDIRRRLLELSSSPKHKPDPTSRLLNDLQETERKTQKTLEELKSQLHSIEEKGKKNVLPVPIVYNTGTGNNLVSEIRALRQNYLHLGGSDPGILAQLADMISEAQALEDKNKNKNPPAKAKVSAVSPQIEALELENARLQRELLLMEERKAGQKLFAEHSQNGELERQLMRLEQDHTRKMSELQLEIERLRQQGELEKYKRELAEDVARDSKPPPVHVVNPEPVPYLPPKPFQYEMEPLGPNTYDPHHGFAIFYDFVRGLPHGCLATRLVVALYDSQMRVGEAAILPPVNVESTGGRDHLYTTPGALIGARQPVPRCQPQSDLGIVVELQVTSPSGGVMDPNRLISKAWAKLSLFDEYNGLTTGRFCVPLRNLPIIPLSSFRDLHKVTQYGDAYLYYRIVHARDAPRESHAPVGFQFAAGYRPPPLVAQPFLLQGTLDPPPPPSVTPPPSTPREIIPSGRQSSPMTPVNATTTAAADRTIGFQVDRVKNADTGQGKVRLTAYHASTGKVVNSLTSPVTCSTTAVHSNFKQRYHVFGQQEATFEDVDIKGDIVIIARFYLKRRDYHTDGKQDYLFDVDSSQVEELVAWGAMPLISISKSGSRGARSRRGFDPSEMRLQVGTHCLRLYRPPVPDASQIPLEAKAQPREWVRYRRATVRFHIFEGTPRPESLTPSERSDDDEDTTRNSWIPVERKVSPSEPYTSGDGFDIYIDGCRFLPDSVTISRVAGRVIDRRYGVYGPDIITGVHLDSDIYNPVYEHKEEIRDPDIPPSSTLVLKVYTIDKFSRKLTCVGFATLNIFVECGTERQPSADSGVQISLNEGAHQLRLYLYGPDGKETVTEICLRDNQIRYIPCASVLVRLVKPVRDKNGRPLESSRIEESDWMRLGLWQPRPAYTDKVYYSDKCCPTQGERHLFRAMEKRQPVSQREIVSTLIQAKESFLNSDNNLAQYIRNQLTRTSDAKPLDQDINYITSYSPRHGIKVAVDGACNIPWTNFTQASVCLNPPGAFYMGSSHATFDKLKFTNSLDLSSTNTSPVWTDGFQNFPNRTYHKYLTAIIHLQEVAVSLENKNYKYGLLDQAWTAVQIFTEDYAYSMVFQLPLFKGAPKPEMLKQLIREPCKSWLERNLTNNTLKLVPGCSVFIRLCDGRRDEELPNHIPPKGKVEINLDYIPSEIESDYQQKSDGNLLETLVPLGKNPEDFATTLGVKFKSLVYKLYEEGNTSS